MEIIMNDILKYDLHYDKLNNENIDELREKLKGGIKCLLTFDFNNKQWHKFTKYFEDSTKKTRRKNINIRYFKSNL